MEKEFLQCGFILVIAIVDYALWTRIIDPWLSKRNRNKVHYS